MKLSKARFESISKFINDNAREIDKKLFACYFENGSEDDVISALTKYQNADGGFGHGLESDFRTPTSSAIATTIALQYLGKIQVKDENDILQKALDYFKYSYHEQYNKWLIVPNDVEEYPHAPWWFKREIDNPDWENPTVEIVGYLNKYPNNFPKDELELLNNKIIEKLLSYENKVEEHDLFCYLRFYDNAKNEVSGKIKDKLSDLIIGTVNTNPKEWKESYVPKPLNFVKNPNSDFYSILKLPIEKHLEFLINNVEENDAWYPVWDWGGNYLDEWEKAKIEWAGKICVENLIILDSFSWIEK